MVETTLCDRCILVVEDEYFLADDLCQALARLGATVIGPVPHVDEALAVARDEPRIDLAVLDINLGGEMAFPVADMLAGRGIPFAFITGYDKGALPARFAAAPRLEKPLRPERLCALLTPLLDMA